MGEIETSLAQFEDLPIIVGGDINTDLNNFSPHSVVFQSFMKAHKLVLCNNLIAPNLNYTYFNEALGHRSLTDFFLVSTSLISLVNKNYIVENIVNLSDHLPIFMELIFPPWAPPVRTSPDHGAGGGLALRLPLASDGIEPILHYTTTKLIYNFTPV